MKTLSLAFPWWVQSCPSSPRTGGPKAARSASGCSRSSSPGTSRPSATSRSPTIPNYPLDAFDRTDGRERRWPTLGATVLPTLPAGDVELIPELRLLRRIPGFPYLESVVVTAAFGRDQRYLDQPWIRGRSIAVDSLGVNPFDFSIGHDVAEKLYESGRAAATAFFAHASRSAAT